MNIIQNNPYRILGLLVGASALKLNRHRTRLPNYISSCTEIPLEFTENSFEVLGTINLTEQSIADASSKLNLDSDKMSAALFWFYKGNPITDEPAFDAIKEADLDQVINIWTKLTSNGEVSQRNASAYSNLGTLYLSGILEGTNTNEAILEQGISLKLKFLESDFIKDFKALATDETYKTTKKELQLLFLNQVQSEVEKSGTVTSNKLLDILTKQEFSAKEDFLKGFVQKPIEQIEKKVEEAKTKRKANKANAVNIGKALFEQTSENLKQLKSILGTSNLKFSSISDKVSDEILQCCIDYFNDSQEKDNNSDYAETSIKLAKQAETLAFGKLIKDRVKDTIETLVEMKDIEISQAIQALQSVKDAYETNKEEINAKVRSMHLGYNQTLDWGKVEKMIENSLNWNKVVELIQNVIPTQNIDKIKNVNNQTTLNQYKSLVTFVMSKLNYSQKNKVRYISYWEAQGGVAMPTTGDIEKIPDWIKWVAGIVIFFILIKACN